MHDPLFFKYHHKTSLIARVGGMQNKNALANNRNIIIKFICIKVGTAAVAFSFSIQLVFTKLNNTLNGVPSSRANESIFFSHLNVLASLRAFKWLHKIAYLALLNRIKASSFALYEVGLFGNLKSLRYSI